MIELLDRLKQTLTSVKAGYNIAGTCYYFIDHAPNMPNMASYSMGARHFSHALCNVLCVIGTKNYETIVGT